MSKKISQKNKIRDLYARFSFLIPVLLGVILSYLVYDSVIWENQRSSAITIILCFIFIFTIFTRGTWKMYRDPEFRKKVIEQKNKEKGKPWYERGPLKYHLDGEYTEFVAILLFSMMFVAIICFFAFFLLLFGYGKVLLYLPILGTLLCYCYYKISKNPKKYLHIILGGFLIFLIYICFFYSKV